MINDKNRVTDAIQDLYLRIQPPAAASLLWERVLTASERKKLGGDFQNCYARLGTAGIWMQVRAVSRLRATLDVAHELGFLTDGDYRWLLRETGESPPGAARRDRPVWNHGTGELRLGTRLLRRVRVMARPSNIQRVLDAFQAANWTTQVASPLTHGQQQLHQALRSLNKGLKRIRFHSQGGAEAITWSFA